MSSSATVSPLIVDVLAFFSALADLKRAAAKCESLRTADGAVHQVEAVFDDGLGRQAGLQKTDKGYRIVADCHGLSPAQRKTQAESIREIVQRYSYRKVLQQLQSEGYAVASEQKQGDGSIRLLVRKWSA